MVSLCLGNMFVLITMFVGFYFGVFVCLSFKFHLTASSEKLRKSTLAQMCVYAGYFTITDIVI